jgi:hypothetical protein
MAGIDTIAHVSTTARISTIVRVSIPADIGTIVRARTTAAIVATGTGPIGRGTTNTASTVHEDIVMVAIDTGLAGDWASIELKTQARCSAAG